MKRFWQFIVLLSLAWPLAAHAHTASDSYLQITIADHAVTGRWDIALDDLERAIGLDTDQDGSLSWGEVRQRQAQIEAYAQAHLKLSRSERNCALTVAGLAVSTRIDGRYAALEIQGNCPPSSAPLIIAYSLLFDIDRQHRGLAAISLDNKHHSRVFSPDTAIHKIEGTSAWKTFRSFVAEGVHHILIGYDHILFLLSLLLPAVLIWRGGKWEPKTGFKSAFWDTARTVTAFTIAHSITLGLAALDIVRVDSQIIESVIAFSVIVAAANNLRPFLPGERWGMALVFGLVHGFGFASVLSEIGLPANQLAIALGAFNVGVEAGQLLIVALFLPLAYLIRNSRLYRRGFMQLGSIAIMLVAAWWFCQRAFGIS